MEISILENESQLLQGNVIRLSNWESVHEIIVQEQTIIGKYNPVYIYFSIDATDLSAIQIMENADYHFSEFRIQSYLTTSDAINSKDSNYPHSIELIGKEKHIKKAIEILQANDADDRFSNDPMIGKDLARKRRIDNLNKSFHSHPHEFVLGLINTARDELIAFRSGAYPSQKEAFFYQYGVALEYDFNHYATILDSGVISYLKKHGTNIIHSVSTGFNISELNRLIKKNDFQIQSSQIVMKKIFNVNRIPG